MVRLPLASTSKRLLTATLLSSTLLKNSKDSSADHHYLEGKHFFRCQVRGAIDQRCRRIVSHTVFGLAGIPDW